MEIGGGELSAEVQGGAWLTVSSLRQAGRELLLAPGALPAPYTVHGRRAGITLLHPWANRLGADRFPVDGREVDVAADNPLSARDPHGLAIHGLAHPTGWQVEPLGESAACASARWPELAAFPFPHAVEVRFELEPPGRLTVTTTLLATGAVAVPVAFGWHPYFAATAPVLSLPQRRALASDQLGLPTRATTPEGPVRAAPSRSLDDGFAGIADGAIFELATRDRRIAVRHDHGFPCAQVFAPLDAEVVSLEPMTAPTDALRTGDGLRFALPAQPYTARFTITVEETRT